MIERIKTVLGIKDTLQDEVLDIFIDNVTRHLSALLGKEVPAHLHFIVEEIVVRRFNRIGSESMKTESVEGHSITFYDLDKEFTPYEPIIDAEKDKTKGINSRGKVYFI